MTPVPSDLWMQTFSGLAFTPADPHGDQTVLADIAQGLANMASEAAALIAALESSP